MSGRVEKVRAALSLYVTAAPLPDQYFVFIWRQHPHDVTMMEQLA
jgi:hypothetical protein